MSGVAKGRRAAIRGYRNADLPDLYRIVAANAADRYADDSLMGCIYSAPYAAFGPHMVFVVEDEIGVGGYIVGTLDTRAFEARLEREWWPALRARHPEPTGDPGGWTADQRRHDLIHKPRRVPEAVARAYPAHIHMHVLPRLQGQGMGGRLLARWRSAAGSSGQQAIHVGVNRLNGRAVAFWASHGFRDLEIVDRTAPNTVWLGSEPLTMGPRDVDVEP